MEQRSLDRDRARRTSLGSRRRRHEGRHRRRDRASRRCVGSACASPATSSSARSPTRSPRAPAASPPSPSGVGADAGIAERTDFEAWVACRGTLTPTITVEGRAGHAEMRQPHWSAGRRRQRDREDLPVFEAVQAIRDDWRTRPDQHHPLLSPGDIVPTIVNGGTWEVTYPARATLTCDSSTCPATFDADGTGRAIERRSRSASMPRSRRSVVRRASAALGVGRGLRAGRDAGRPSAGRPPPRRPARSAGRAARPASTRGTMRRPSRASARRPSRSARGHRERPHDRRVDDADSLVDHAAALALVAMRWCGVAPATGERP